MVLLRLLHATSVAAFRFNFLEVFAINWSMFFSFWKNLEFFPWSLVSIKKGGSRKEQGRDCKLDKAQFHSNQSPTIFGGLLEAYGAVRLSWWSMASSSITGYSRAPFLDAFLDLFIVLNWDNGLAISKKLIEGQSHQMGCYRWGPVLFLVWKALPRFKYGLLCGPFIIVDYTLPTHHHLYEKNVVLVRFSKIH